MLQAVNLPSFLMAGVLALVPFHAFLTVWASTTLGHYTLLRLWPECVLLLLAGWFFVSGQLPRVWRSWQDAQLGRFHLGWSILLYLLIAILYFVFALVRGRVGVQAASYGLLLATRPVVWFVLAYAVALKNSWLLRHWKKLVLVPLAIVAGFALVQFFVLPADFLKHFGYVQGSTIAPVQTINQDTSTIRAQSFLRGPNPLGAYLLLGIVLAYAGVKTQSKRGALVIVALTALAVSFSRSAWLGLPVAAVAWLAVTRGVIKDSRRIFAVLSGVLLVIMSLVILLQTNQGAKNALLHVNDNSTAPQTSNEDRLAALRQGARDVLHEPLGRGPGTAGPASVYSDAEQTRNSENYFLGLGQEFGWLGLGLFVTLSVQLALSFYRRADMVSRGLFASLIGLTLVNLLSYAWADVTLAYLWWGLAGNALASNPATPRGQGN